MCRSGASCAVLLYNIMYVSLTGIGQGRVTKNVQVWG